MRITGVIFQDHSEFVLGNEERSQELDRWYGNHPNEPRKRSVISHIFLAGCEEWAPASLTGLPAMPLHLECVTLDHRRVLVTPWHEVSLISFDFGEPIVIAHDADESTSVAEVIAQAQMGRHVGQLAQEALCPAGAAECPVEQRLERMLVECDAIEQSHEGYHDGVNYGLVSAAQAIRRAGQEAVHA